MQKKPTEATALTTAETARRADVSVKTITRWVADGKLVPVRRLPGPRGAYLFDPTAVDAVIRARQS